MSEIDLIQSIVDFNPKFYNFLFLFFDLMKITKFKINFFSKNSNCMYLNQLQCRFVYDPPILQYTENWFRLVSIELWMCAVATKRTTFTFYTVFYYRTLFSNMKKHFFEKTKKAHQLLLSRSMPVLSTMPLTNVTRNWPNVPFSAQNFSCKFFSLLFVSRFYYIVYFGF